MKKLLLLPITLLLVGCDVSGGMGSWSNPGTPGVYSCEYAEGGAGAQAWCDTGEHPNLCDC